MEGRSFPVGLDPHQGMSLLIIADTQTDLAASAVIKERILGEAS